MYGYDIQIDNRTNKQLIKEMIKLLKIKHGERHGLKNKSNSPLLEGTIMQKRGTCMTYNAELLNEENALLFTGQCLIKEDDDPECPITLQDAVECARLRALLELHPLPALCMYPDSTYAKFIQGWSGRDVDEKSIHAATDRYIAFRKNMLPGVEHIRVSDFQEVIDQQISGQLSQEERNSLRTRIKRIYGGRFLRAGQEHPLQEVILEYGIKTVLLPSLKGYGNRDIAVFAEPAEVCSVYSTEFVSMALRKDTEIGLIAQLPVPSLEFLIDRKLDMYSARREARIHLNEPDGVIRRKLEAEPDFCLVSLALSPLTTEAQLDELGKSRKREEGIDLMMGQIEEFRRYLS